MNVIQDNTGTAQAARIHDPEEAEMKHVSFVIKDVTVSGRTICRTCEVAVREGKGARVCIEGSTNVLCDGCAARFAPALAEALNTLWGVEREREDRMRQLKRQLLLKYGDRQPKRFAQYDGFKLNGGDDVMRPDENGRSVMYGETWELMHGSNVRVLISQETKKDDVLALLARVVDMIERDGVYETEKLFPPSLDISATRSPECFF